MVFITINYRVFDLFEYLTNRDLKEDVYINNSRFDESLK